MDDKFVVEEVHQASALARTIKPIDTQAVHKICSGQVVLTLATAVKELVENSLDAGSTSVEICLKEYGVESIEVIDNGCGVEESNFEALTLKHHTSKLSEFEDLANVNTFGFRGEALSSLCCLGDLSITTCHKNSSVGQKLVFDHCGKLCKQTAVSRQTGTTVTIRNLFSTLPVRHKEFVKNIKREYAKMLQVLYAYCLVTTDARISCANKIGQSKSVVVATQGQNNPRENICSVFGSKQLTALLEIRQHSISQAVLCEYNLKDDAVNSDLFCIRGFVSSCQHGSGRSSADRQFYYINGRPCDLAKLSKVVNEVYHSYNRHQYPFVMLDVTLSRDSVDINVTPDKRLLFIENEKTLLAIVKSSLDAMFSSLGSIIQSSQPVLNNSVNSPTFTFQDFLAKKSINCSPNNSSQVSQIDKSSLLSLFKRNKGENSGVWKRQRSDNGSVVTSELGSSTSNKQPRLENYFFNKMPKIPEPTPPNSDDFGSPNLENSSLESAPESEIPSSQETCEDEVMELPSVVEKCNQTSLSGSSESDDGSDDGGDPDVECVTPPEQRLNLMEPNEKVEIEMDEASGSPRKSITMPFSITSVRERLKKTNESHSKLLVRRFRAKIEPGDNSAAEEELKKEISKECFRKMEIIGQFNLGFIVAKLDSDLFIIDQHATDEKFNFEMLRKNTVLNTQPLIRPLSMELTAMNETILLENHETFRKNGFTFEIDEQSKSGKRVKLVAVPMSKNWAFGKEDIEEMIFMLSEAAPGVMCRPSRIQEMFASRACRMSVMIGTALSRSDMRRLVLHMGEMDQPWNCPHQRPTIRHLINLDMINV